MSAHTSLSTTPSYAAYTAKKAALATEQTTNGYQTVAAVKLAEEAADLLDACLREAR